MSFGERKCDDCGRSHYGEDPPKPLEVCFDHVSQKWLCKRCFLAPKKIEE